MPDTEAEKQFERFCDLRGIRRRRIRPAHKDGYKRPDYAIRVDGAGCVAEVKQLDPNDEDVRRERELGEQKHTSWSGEPGRRVRGKISGAAGQLRRFATRGMAGILVLFDGTSSLHYLDQRNVMAGMYGRDTLEIVRIPGRRPRWHTSRWTSGGKEKLTPKTNTSISALAVLHIGPDRNPYVVVYHNEYAAVPLDGSCVARATDHQFVREIRWPKGVNVWIHAITGEVLK